MYINRCTTIFFLFTEYVAETPKTIMNHADVLNNEHRRYFGLDPIDPKWDEVEIKPGFVVFFEKNTIKKTISLFNKEFLFEYDENDTALLTKNREIVLPKTAKGKEKKLNYTSVSSARPEGCCFHLEIRYSRESSYVRSYNPRNHLSLPLCEDDQFRTIDDYITWRDKFPAMCPEDYFEKVDEMRHRPHKTVKYYNGDIYRYEIDLENYGFGLVIGQIEKMRKDGILPKEHALNHVMTVPLLIRPYRIMTKNKNMPIEEILAAPLLPTEIICDNHLIWGVAEIVGHKNLEASDIDFPMHVVIQLPKEKSPEGQRKEKRIKFSWGTGMKMTDWLNLEEITKTMESPFGINEFGNAGAKIGIWTDPVLREFRGESPRVDWSDICHPKNAKHKKTVFRYLELPEKIDFDTFNTRYGGMTREQYAEYANQYTRAGKPVKKVAKKTVKKVAKKSVKK